ncbi:MAG TPA: hypothetical protein VEL76_32565 [Gemmataceae bacterium]|nr:hypothetical protein [Gemmataceae bacterium]
MDQQLDDLLEWLADLEAERDTAMDPERRARIHQQIRELEEAVNRLLGRSDER